MRDMIMGVILVVLLSIVVTMGGTSYRHQEKQIQELNAKFDLILRITPLEIQERCARQAREEFDREGWTKKPGEIADFEDHYNAKLNKCFMRVRSSDIKGTTSIVTDAFEGKNYGYYLWFVEAGKSATAVPPADCEVTLPSSEEIVCHSSIEFDALIKQYMQ